MVLTDDGTQIIAELKKIRALIERREADFLNSTNQTAVNSRYTVNAAQDDQDPPFS